MNKKMLTAVVPIGNAAGMLDNFRDWFTTFDSELVELIVCLDGNDLQTRMELNSILELRNKRDYIFISGEFGSPGLARNAGLQLAKSSWVVFWDCDDIPRIDVILRATERATILRKECVVGSFEMKWIDSNIPSKRYVFSPNYLKEISLNPGIWRFAFRRESLNGIKFSELMMGEDQIFLSIYELATRNVYVSQEIFYTYVRGHKNQLTSNKVQISRLHKATQKLIAVRKLQISENKIITELMILRQLVTAIKHNSILDKVRALQVIAKVPSLTFSIFKSYKLSKSSTIFLTGGLGNQLFQIAAGLALSDKKSVVINTNFGKPRLNHQGITEIESIPFDNIWFEKKKILFGNFVGKSLAYSLRRGIKPTKLESNVLIKKILRLLTEFILSIAYVKRIKLVIASDVGYFKMQEKKADHIFYVGYFQSHIWPDSINFKDFVNSFSENNSNLNKFTSDASREKPLIVHVRLKDYETHQNFGIPSDTYYRNSLAQEWNPSTFGKIWLFSDDISKAKKIIPKDFIEVTRLIDEPLMESADILKIMKLGRSYVIANSTFSWWGAYLSSVESGKIIAPNPWFQFEKSPNEIIPPNWSRLNAWVPEL
jgi:hypothetical protein